MRAVKELKRLDSDPPDYPPPLPNVRRRIVIADYDNGRTVHTMEFRRCNRVDCYDVYADGKLWKRRIGWSSALEGLRKAFPRIMSYRALS